MILVQPNMLKITASIMPVIAAATTTLAMEQVDADICPASAHGGKNIEIPNIAAKITNALLVIDNSHRGC